MSYPQYGAYPPGAPGSNMPPGGPRPAGPPAMYPTAGGAGPAGAGPAWGAYPTAGPAGPAAPNMGPRPMSGPPTAPGMMMMPPTGAPGMPGRPPMGGPPVGAPYMPGPHMGPPGPPMGAPAMSGPPMGGAPMGAPPMGGPQMGAPSMGAPPMGAPSMGAPPMGGPSMGAPPMGGPPLGAPSMGMAGPGMNGPPMGGAPMGAPPAGYHGQPPLMTMPAAGARPIGPPPTGPMGPPTSLSGGPSAPPVSMGGPPTAATSVAPPPPPMAGMNPAMMSGPMSTSGLRPMPNYATAAPPPHVSAAPPPMYNPAAAAASPASGVPAMPTPSSSTAKPAFVDTSLNCSKSFMRLTVPQLPNTTQLRDESRLPLGLVVQPLAAVPGAEPLPVVNFGVAGVIRCSRCRGYIHPFVKFQDTGRTWKCTVCGKSNDVPSPYFSHLDEQGNRKDIAERPELRSGSVEIIAPAEYMVRPPQAPVYMFVLDVSHNAVASGMLKFAVDAIRHTIETELLPGGERTQVGFITYDSSVHFYNLKSSLSAPQMLVVPDVTDLFLPIPDELLVNLSDSLTVVQGLLSSLPEMFASSDCIDSCLGPALDAAYKVMRHIGGKMVVTCATLPSIGPGRLRGRDNPKLLGTEMEHTLLNPDNAFYKDLGIEFSKQQICVDLFMACPAYSDVATIGTLAQYTAGDVFYYQNFNQHVDGPRFRADLVHVLSRTTGFEAVMRVRCTKGVRIAYFHGNFYARGTDLIALPNATSDTVCAVELDLETVLSASLLVTIQAALLYTTSSGERRICVHTLACSVTALLSQVFQQVDPDSICTIIAKQAIDRVRRTGFASARTFVHRSCVAIMQGYRRASQVSYGAPMQGQQQLLPESLQALPLLTLGLLKSPLLRSGNDLSSDVRAALLHLFQGAGAAQTMAFIHPQLYSLHDLEPRAGLPGDAKAIQEYGLAVAGQSMIVLPRTKPLTASQLIAEGVYLLNDRVDIFLWLGRAVQPQLINALFGVPSLHGVDATQLALVPRDNEYSTRVMNIVNALRESSPVQSLRIVIQAANTVDEVRFMWRLIEDQASYPSGRITTAEFVNQLAKEAAGPAVVPHVPTAGATASGAAAPPS